jgi:hypothetical protein
LVIYGSIELFPFLGARRGKAAVLEVCRQISENVWVHRFNRESIVPGEDTQASPPFSARSGYAALSLLCQCKSSWPVIRPN